jgi:hypothetical protein
VYIRSFIMYTLHLISLSRNMYYTRKNEKCICHLNNLKGGDDLCVNAVMINEINLRNSE